MIKHYAKANRGGKGLFAYRFQSIGKEPRQGLETEINGRTLLAALLR